jgi:hypothetical protein
MVYSIFGYVGIRVCGEKSESHRNLTVLIGPKNIEKQNFSIKTKH